MICVLQVLSGDPVSASFLNTPYLRLVINDFGDMLLLVSTLREFMVLCIMQLFICQFIGISLTKQEFSMFQTISHWSLFSFTLPKSHFIWFFYRHWWFWLLLDSLHAEFLQWHSSACKNCTWYVSGKPVLKYTGILFCRKNNSLLSCTRSWICKLTWCKMTQADICN